MCDVNKDCIRCTTYENNRKVLCLVLNEAPHGCAQSALLWCKLFSATLLCMALTLNPHGPCVANKVIDCKQCTIVWNTDDSKMSHKDESVESMFCELQKKFVKCILFVATLTMSLLE